MAGNAAGRAAHLWVGLASAAMASDASRKASGRHGGAGRCGEGDRRASWNRCVRPGDRRLSASDRGGAAKRVGRGSRSAPPAHGASDCCSAARNVAATACNGGKRRATPLVCGRRNQRHGGGLGRQDHPGRRRRERPGHFRRARTNALQARDACGVRGRAGAARSPTARCANKSIVCCRGGSSRIQIQTRMERCCTIWRPPPASARMRSGRNVSNMRTMRLRIVQMSLEVAGSGPLVERAIERASIPTFVRVRGLLSSVPSGSVARGRREIEAARLSHDCTARGARAARRGGSRRAASVDVHRRLHGTARCARSIGEPDHQAQAARQDCANRPRHRPLVVARLDDERWYVQRNMLLLLERLQRVPPRLLGGRLDAASRRSCSAPGHPSSADDSRREGTRGRRCARRCRRTHRAPGTSGASGRVRAVVRSACRNRGG